jgi:glycosyltransferase involved in cell wall biosynthesis
MTAGPSITVVVPSYKAERTLDRCLASVLGQDIGAEFEVVVVVSADTAAELPRLPIDRRLRVDTHVPRLSAAVARNRGVELASADLLAFIDADAVAERTWLTGLVAASSGGADCVAGALVNGTPDSAVGTAEYLVAFIDLSPNRPPETSWHGATCNLLVPRPLWDHFGPFPLDMLGGEDTMLTTAAHQAGRLRFAPDARVVHLNRTSVGAVVRHQYEYGRFSAQLGRRCPGYRWRVFVRHTVLAPLAGAARFGSVYARGLRWTRPSSWSTLLRAAPVTLAALVGWTIGLAVEGRRLDHARGAGA